MLPKINKDFVRWWFGLNSCDQNWAVISILHEMQRIPFPAPRFAPERRDQLFIHLATHPGSLTSAYVTNLATSYFPHFHEVRLKDRSVVEAWYRDRSLKQAILYCLRAGTPPGPDQIRAKLRQRFGEVSNFRVKTAKYLYERYTKPGALVLDPSAGWGARQIAARAYGLHYIGLDPEPRTIECGLRLAADLDRVYGGSTRLIRSGSEVFDASGLEGEVDFVFTSPPYFNLEPYSDHPDQSHVRYQTLEAWYDGFVRETASRVSRVLKPNGLVAINVSWDYSLDFIECYEQAGFQKVDVLPYLLREIHGRIRLDQSERRLEPIIIFQKKESRRAIRPWGWSELTQVERLRFSEPNTKLQKAGDVWSFNLPAWRSADGFKVCIGAKGCEKWCYALQGFYRRPVVKKVREDNLRILRACKRDSSAMAALLDEAMSTLPDGVDVVRIHDSGDFYSSAYLAAWLRVIEQHPGITFYAYTKSIPLFDGLVVPRNFIVTYSEGGKWPVPEGASRARVFLTHQAREAAGYVDGATTDEAAIKGEERVGLVAHGQRTPTPEELE